MATTNYELYKNAWVYSGAINKEPILEKSDVHAMLSSGGWMVRNVYNFDCGAIDRPTNFWYVIKDHFGGFEELSSKTRNQVRRGLANYTIRSISPEEMAQYGYPIYAAASASYKITAKVTSKENFRSGALKGKPSQELWGAFNSNNEMVAYASNYVENSICNYSALKAYPADMKNYVYYALIYEMNRHYLEERKLKFVCDGARSITEHSNIQPFLEEKFHFRKAYCHMKIYYKWWFGTLVKILYPFRNIIPNHSIKSLLAMHGMQG